MPSNISQNTTPSFWSSANDDVIFTFSFNAYVIDSISNSGGSTYINLQNDFDIPPVPGEYLYINSNVYIGTFKILAAFGTSAVLIDTPYISNITSNVYYCYHLRVPVFSLYKGYKPLELFPVDLPYIRVVDMKPSILYSDSTGIPYLEINVRSITRSLFSILSNSVANSTDFSMFNAIRFIWDGLTTKCNSIYDYNLILNAAITTEDLNLNYVSSGLNGSRYLIPIDKPLIATDGSSLYSVFEVVIINIPIFGPFPVGIYPVVHKFINGVKQ